ncbi:MAG: elongation factor G [Actinobacteria bacterium]|nr:elongation factor G [Actinomycetota bacterium]MCL5025733.1 elongation factor G [Chloroflexota bacterium]
MKTHKTTDIRNIGLFSHGGTGKTSLAEAMLYNAGVINRLGEVEDGTTVSDYEPEETKRHISIQLALTPLEWKDTKLNIVDTPGYADFVGEVREAVRVVDGALILVSAVSGIEVGTDQMWRYADEYHLPRAVFINVMDRENADFLRTLGQLRERYGTGVVPIQLPIGAQESFRGLVDLVANKALLFGAGGLQEAAVPAEVQSEADSWREKVIEAAAETNDELVNKYLEGEPLTEAEIKEGLRAGVLAGSVVPVLVGSATQNKGVGPVLDALVEYLPSPVDAGEVTAANAQSQAEEKLAPSDAAPLAALVFKTTADPYVGKLTYFRVYSGVMHSDHVVWNATKSRDERVGQLFIVRGKTQEPVTQLGAGDIGAVAKLQETGTGDTLSSKEHPVTLPGITFPNPLFTAAVQPKTKADLDKLGNALARQVEEDRTLQLRRELDTGEMLLSGMGDSHIDVTAERIRRKFGVELVLSVPKVPYKETILTSTKAEYKHKKQTGGHGQYGHVFLAIEPLPRGSGFQFEEKVVGGVVPKQYIPGVEKGVREALGEGVQAGYPMVDLKVTLYDGSYHPVDSSEMAFKIAASQAFKKGVNQANPVLLEPIMNITIRVPEQYMGDVVGELNTKRARVLGMSPEDGISVIEAQVPLAEVQRYSTDLRSITQGRGTYTIEFSHYEEVPAHVAQQVIAEGKKAAAAKE